MIQQKHELDERILNAINYGIYGRYIRAERCLLLVKCCLEGIANAIFFKLIL